VLVVADQVFETVLKCNTIAYNTIGDCKALLYTLSRSTKNYEYESMNSKDFSCHLKVLVSVMV